MKKEKVLSLIVFILLIISGIVLSLKFVTAENNETNQTNDAIETIKELNSSLCAIEINNKESQLCTFYNQSNECTFSVNATITKVNITKYAFNYYLADINNKIITKKQTIHIRGKNTIVSRIFNISIVYGDIKQKKAQDNQTDYQFLITGCDTAASLPITINREVVVEKLIDARINSTDDYIKKDKLIKTQKKNKKIKEIVAKVEKKKQKSITKIINPITKAAISPIKEIIIEQPLLNKKDKKDKKEEMLIRIDNNLSNLSINYYGLTNSSIKKSIKTLQQLQNNSNGNNNGIVIYQSKTRKISKLIPYILLLFIIVIMISFKLYKSKTFI